SGSSSTPSVLVAPRPAWLRRTTGRLPDPETMGASKPAVLWRTLVTDTAVLCLTLIQFFGRPGVLETWRHLASALQLDSTMASLHRWLNQGPEARFHARVFWAAARALGLLVIPAAVVVLVLRRPLTDFGLRTRGILPHAWMYLALLALITPAV